MTVREGVVYVAELEDWTDEPQPPDPHAVAAVAADVVENHVKVAYDPEPPEGFAVSPRDCPLSMEGFAGVGSPAVSAPVVATVAEGNDVVVSGDVAVSVTLSSKL